MGMHLVSLIRYLAMPDPMEIAKKHTREMYKSLGRDLPEDYEQKMEKEIDKLSDGKLRESLQLSRESLQRSRTNGLLIMIGSFLLSLILLTFLYLRHDWARLVLGALFLIGGCIGLVGLVLSGTYVLRVLSTGMAILTVVEMLVRLGISFGIGMALIKSERIAAYTSGR